MQNSFEHQPVMIGGMVMDLRGRPAEHLQLYTSNPGSMTQIPGGVGRNIAENLVRLGVKPFFISAVGSDMTGDLLVTHSMGIGLSTEGIFRITGERSAIYLAILNEDGDLHTAIADMAIFTQLTPERIFAHSALLQRAPLVMMDTNLPVETLEAVADFCVERKIPLLVEPVSVEKSRKLHGLLGKISYLTPNLDELAALAGIAISTEEDQQRAISHLLTLGVRNLVITLGKEGALLANEDGIRHFPAFPAQVVDVTGAGDSFVAGMAYGILRGISLEESLRYGMALGKCTVETAETVWSKLTLDVIHQLLMEV